MSSRVLVEAPPLATARPAAPARPAAATRPTWSDPRTGFAAILTVYAVLGATALTFNRGPGQMLVTVLAACLLDMGLHAALRERRLVWPLSAYISGLSLALLLNYSHDSYVLVLPVYLAIASKYVLTYGGAHVFNPSMFGIAVSLLVSGDLIAAAPAYQWGGTIAMSAFIVTSALALFVFRIGRNALILAFLGFYTLQIALRAWVMRWYLPWDALVLGTLTSAPFFLFVFFMITDPKTSPPGRQAQVLTALALVLADLAFHLVSSVYTFFYAAFTVALGRFVFLHGRRLWRDGPAAWLRDGLLHPRTLRTVALVAALGLAQIAVYRGLVHPSLPDLDPGFRLEPVSAARSGITAEPAPIWDAVDPRVRHIAKWLLSAGSAVATGDVDGDGRLDLFVTNPLMRPEDRNALYRNLGDFRFARVPLPALDALSRDPVRHGLTGLPLFADVDNDGDQDLFLAVGYGPNVLLRNLLAETGRAELVLVPDAGVADHAVSIAANFLDYDRDGRIDLVVGNAFATHLQAYPVPPPFSIFRLPAPEHPGDRRMLGFMHASWDNAKNGGLNALYRNVGEGRFAKQDAAAMGMPETHWSLAVGTGDLNQDGWTDFYVANDFGPDDLYLNEQGRRFRRIQGPMFGTVGRDTYKGMNASLGDLDRNGWLDIYVSNVHVPLQAEGSLLWMTYPNARNPFVPRFVDEATGRGALNERRFGWGAALGDLDLDGWLDIVQANGMVDDALDRRFPRCPSYWYVNEKLMRSGPEIHTYADKWGDLRGYCIFGREANRVYLSRGGPSRPVFVDVAARLGWTAETSSRGMALADLDNDGDLDLLVTHQFGPLSVYRNTREDASLPGGHPRWIGFQLEGDGVTCNRDGAGSRVWIDYEEDGKPARQLREVTIANGLSAQSDRRLLFGLGRAAGPVTATVAWCGGPPRRLPPLAAGRYHHLRQD